MNPPILQPSVLQTPVAPGQVAGVPAVIPAPVVQAPVTGAGRFATLDDFTPEEQANKQTRVFVGDGTSFLDVPGLTALYSIRVGNSDLPLFETRSYPVDTVGTQQRVNEPLVSLQRRSNDTPVLIRAVISNDGIWPKDANIYITGEWEPEPDPEDEYPEEPGALLSDAVGEFVDTGNATPPEQATADKQPPTDATPPASAPASRRGQRS